jgi:uncharacterized protein with WD repeat
MAIEYSPRDTYLMSCERYIQGEKNLVVWDTHSGKEVAGFPWNKASKEGPKSLKFTSDERFCARITSPTTISIYDLTQNNGFATAKHKLVASHEMLGP